MLYLGDPIDAQTALAYGMVNRVVPARRAAGGDAEVRAPDGAHLAGGAHGAPSSRSAAAPTPPASATRSAPASTCWPALYAARTEVGMKFDEIREKEGLGAALKWQAAQFAE